MSIEVLLLPACIEMDSFGKGARRSDIAVWWEEEEEALPLSDDSSWHSLVLPNIDREKAVVAEVLIAKKVFVFTGGVSLGNSVFGERASL